MGETGACPLPTALHMPEPRRAAAAWRALSLPQLRRSAGLAAQAASAPLRLYLRGGLGAGKTEWTRAFLRALGEGGHVPSPSFALAHSYATARLRVHHLDCYRMQGAAVGDDLLELLQDDDAVCLVEWPQLAAGLPPPDITLRFAFCGANKRHLRAEAQAGGRGEAATKKLAQWRGAA